MIFRYSGIDDSGKKVKGKIEADSMADAKNRLRTKKIIYKSVSQESFSILNNIKFTKQYKISSKELSILSRELSTYIRSGVNIVSAIKIIKVHYSHNKKISLFLETIATLLDEGKNFYTALETQKVIKLPEFFKHSIKVSENGGILDEVLMELSRFLKEQDRINKEIRSALAYPIFMISVSLIMISFMLSFVVPQITEMFENMDQTLPTPTIIVIALSDFLNENFIFLAGSILSVLLLITILIKKNKRFAYGFDKTMLNIPYFGKIIQKSELARFSYMASILTRSGVTFVETVNLSANILNNIVIKKLFLNASDKVVEGKLFSKALFDSKTAIDETFIQSIALGEETSEMENVLTNVSELYFDENKDKISTMLTLLEPALMLFVGGSIGFIVAAMLLPIFSMSIN
jgi:general secretion pathway protein F/type IV pilus assembly protein PilC